MYVETFGGEPIELYVPAEQQPTERPFMSPHQKLTTVMQDAFDECMKALEAPAKPDRHSVMVAVGTIDGGVFQVQLHVTMNEPNFLERGTVEPVDLGDL